MRYLSKVAFVATLLASTSLLTSAAWAGPQWCEEDPEFVVNGAVIDVTTLLPSSYVSSVSGAVNFDVQVPSNAVAAPVSLPGAIPVTASISRTLPAYYGIGALPVVVTVTMKASVAFTTYTMVSGTYGALTSTIQGTSTSSTKAKFSLYGASLLGD